MCFLREDIPSDISPSGKPPSYIIHPSTSNPHHSQKERERESPNTHRALSMFVGCSFLVFSPTAPPRMTFLIRSSMASRDCKWAGGRGALDFVSSLATYKDETRTIPKSNTHTRGKRAARCCPIYTYQYHPSPSPPLSLSPREREKERKRGGLCVRNHSIEIYGARITVRLFVGGSSASLARSSCALR